VPDFKHLAEFQVNGTYNFICQIYNDLSDNQYVPDILNYYYGRKGELESPS
jgi:hypothetical protein